MFVVFPSSIFGFWPSSQGTSQMQVSLDCVHLFCPVDRKVTVLLLLSEPSQLSQIVAELIEKRWRETFSCLVPL